MGKSIEVPFLTHSVLCNWKVGSKSKNLLRQSASANKCTQWVFTFDSFLITIFRQRPVDSNWSSYQHIIIDHTAVSLLSTKMKATMKINTLVRSENKNEKQNENRNRLTSQDWNRSKNRNYISGSELELKVGVNPAGQPYKATPHDRSHSPLLKPPWPSSLQTHSEVDLGMFSMFEHRNLITCNLQRQRSVTNELKRWLGGITVALKGRGFDSRSGCYPVVTTRMGDCLQTGKNHLGIWPTPTPTQPSIPPG